MEVIHVQYISTKVMGPSWDLNIQLLDLQSIVLLTACEAWPTHRKNTARTFALKWSVVKIYLGWEGEFG